MDPMTIDHTQYMRHAKTVAAMRIVAGLVAATAMFVAIRLGNTDLSVNTKMLMIVPAFAIQMVLAYRYYGRAKFLRYFALLLVLSVGSVSFFALVGMLLS